MGIRRTARRVVKWALLLVVALITVAVVVGWRGFGHRATGERRARMERSPEWKGGQFVNPQPLRNDAWGMLSGAWHASPHTSPDAPLPTVKPDLSRPPASGLRVTWLGHSSTLVEIDGQRVLTDPVWSDRVTPIAGVGPRRWYAPPIALAELPPIDAIVISHDHYDHLDRGTVEAMRGWTTPFIVPLGVGAHLAYWGIAPERILELDWWQEAHVGGLTIACTPARHAAGRSLVDNDAKLWAGYALIGEHHRVYYSGDTGLFPAMRDIGSRLGPFDLTMIEIGQYDPAWPDWHIGPEQAVRAHGLIGGRVFLPVHWGALALAYHGWTEPIERALVAAQASGVTILTPRPGQPVEPSSATVGAPADRWWPTLPFHTAAEAPIVSTQMD